MAWTTCQYSRERINAAGREFVTLDPNDARRDTALEVINNWRSAHAYPLQVITQALARRAKLKINPNALVARRTKRLSSIALKLQHNQSMRLSQMQDIGGCRAVLDSVIECEKLVKLYEDALAKHPRLDDRPHLFRKDDYIARPKPDGYRGIHLIMKYMSQSKPAFNEQKIEIQIRSKLQHSWATSVETCQTFTGQALKSKIKSASETWLRFFALMSSAIAARERRPTVPGTPEEKEDRKRELREIQERENIIMLLSGWSAAMKHEIDTDTDATAFLLELDVEKKRLKVSPFREAEMLFANSEYLAREKATEGNQNIQVVLVSADSVALLQRAYPNYYVDTAAFLNAIKQEIY